MDILLIAGLWLDGSAWDDVASALRSRGHRPVPLTLPGQGDGSTSATLEDQAAAVLAAVDSVPGKPMVVGHSAAATLAWLAADARPDKVAKVVFVGGFPTPDGKPYADFSNCATASCLSPAGSRSRERTRPTWTRRPSAPSRRPRSPFPQVWPRAWCG
ncbi:alpha/beta fold hydrolase [Amycolatopsis sp. cmx-4-68]|uniref:alpha/beta fold hydrolase n=1 Tax=Amycolatopsis sp. cmx-4-68 TaxID=2790938 RepID=UPI0039781AB1